MNYQILGTLYTRPELDAEGELITEPVQLEGFHVNTDEPIDGLVDYIVTPTIPRVVFAGIETYHYKFDSEEQARELVPDAFPSETLEDE
jgi:hypothetical protein